MPRTSTVKDDAPSAENGSATESSAPAPEKEKKAEDAVAINTVVRGGRFKQGGKFVDANNEEIE
jgi:hypothetical protein